MYINQIDNIIDQILDNLYINGLNEDPTFKIIVDEKKINFVEYLSGINTFIQKFMSKIDAKNIEKTVSKENLDYIVNIIKRYVAYYYFLSIAFYYTGTLKDFRNNIIQCSILQENLNFQIKNFFDTDNNYKLITFYKLLKDIIYVITLSDIQKANINLQEYGDALSFLKKLGEEYVNNFLLTLTNIGEQKVEINSHNLIKTIVFRELYRLQEQKIIFDILNEIEESKYEYTYIDIVVTNKGYSDFDIFQKVFSDYDNGSIIAKDLFSLLNNPESNQVINYDEKVNYLLQYNIITPIVNDFLRYHKDTEKLATENDKQIIIPNPVNNAKNIQLALLYQQRKKKDNTKAQLIVNRLENISDLYSPNVEKNLNVKEEISKYFQTSVNYRKAVLCNYNEEVKVMTKIENHERNVRENNEYFLELKYINKHAYFNFKDLQRDGIYLILDKDFPLKLIRYSNIEYQKQFSKYLIDMRTVNNGDTINILGFTIGPFNKTVKQCIIKNQLIDLRNINIMLPHNKTISGPNGYKSYIKILKYIYVDTIKIQTNNINIFNDYSEIINLNPDLTNRLIYWLFDITTDTFVMDTYENIIPDNLQDNIKYMLANIYDKLNRYLLDKLVSIINENIYLPYNLIFTIIFLFTQKYKLKLTESQRRELLIKYFLRKIELNKVKIVQEKITHSNIPEIIQIKHETIMNIKINMINPLNIEKFKELKRFNEKSTSKLNFLSSNCKHENEWKDIRKIRNKDLNKYNIDISAFITKYAVETLQMEFICKICGQILPIKQYVQDGSFNNETQQFITSYVPLDIPLEEYPEYNKFPNAIKFLDNLVSNMCLITNTNIFIGKQIETVRKRKALVKNILDIVLKHNTVNLKTNMKERAILFHSNFNINKDLDILFFFDITDNIFDFTISDTEINSSINRLKFNNILLYFILFFILELNASQILSMYTDKVVNVFNFLKYGHKFFETLLIKKNINDTDTIPITDYPVLCYILFNISYVLIKYKRWYYPNEEGKNLNAIIQRIIINSFVDLFNSIALDFKKFSNDYIYSLTINKIYAQLHTIFNNNNIINLLKTRHEKYNPDVKLVTQSINKNVIKIYYLDNLIKEPIKNHKIVSFKLSTGIQMDDSQNLLYRIIPNFTDITNCPRSEYKGDIHLWRNKGKSFECQHCGLYITDVHGTYNSDIDIFYFEMQKIAKKRCNSCEVHKYILENNKSTCTLCNKDVDHKYSEAELDKLEHNINEQNNKKILKLIDKEKNINQKIALQDSKNLAMYKELEIKFEKEFSKQTYGQTNKIFDKLISIMADLIGISTNVDNKIYPLYLKDNVYIIENNYTGIAFPKPLIFTQNENKIIFKEKHPFFNVDVYYYIDNTTIQIEVFYDAITLKLIGYKEKHKNYVTVKNSSVYLKINYSIYNKLLLIGYPTKYIKIKNLDTDFHSFLDVLIIDHIITTKSIVDKFSSIIFKIKNFNVNYVVEDEPLISSTLDDIIKKYSKQLDKLNFGKYTNESIGGSDTLLFDSWNNIRNLFTYQKVVWKDTNIKLPENNFVNTDIINYYDVSSNIIFYFLVNQLIYLINLNHNKTEKITIIQIFIDIINYIYNLYNTDAFKDEHEIKRFDYLIYGSDLLIDLLKKGQGLNESRKIEEELKYSESELNDIDKLELDPEELEDIKEEAEALDIENAYEDDEDEISADSGDYDIE